VIGDWWLVKAGAQDWSNPTPKRSVFDRNGQLGEVNAVGQIEPWRSRADFQVRNLVLLEREDELELDRTAREISGESVGHNRLVVLLTARERLDPVPVFPFGLNLPLLNGSRSFGLRLARSHLR